MKKKFDRYWISRPSGLTLIEVLAGLVLLGTLLAGLVIGYRRHERQVRMARLRLGAVSAADQLLADWFTRPETFPIAAAGHIEHDPRLSWETNIIPGSYDESLGIQRVQLAIRSVSDADADRAVITVEVVLPIEAAGVQISVFAGMTLDWKSPRLIGEN